jgi:tetratricopeptide (TPR) repeat protein
LCSNPDDPTIYKSNGDVLRLLGDQDGKAIDAYSHAIAYGENSVDTYYFRGLIYEKIQNYQNAFSDYCTVLQIDQNHQAAQQAKLRVESKIVQPQTGPWQKIKSLLKLFS